MADNLTANETEQIRDLRSRLNRVPPGPSGEKSVGPLSKGFFDICARVGLPPTADAVVSGDDLMEAIKTADMAGLQAIVGALMELRRQDPSRWRAGYMDNGMLQAVFTRRLVLGGKEQGE
jgi:hypothetical protein